MKKNIFLLVLVLFALSSSIKANNYPEIFRSDRDTITAVYQGLQDEQSLDEWQILGPIPVFDGKPDAANQDAQKKAFDNENLSAAEITSSVKTGKLLINNLNLNWQAVTADEGLIDFLTTYKDTAFMIAYAFAEINMPEAKKVLMGFGSDDAIKVWVNNKLIHSNWIGRAVQKDDDLVLVNLKKGKNGILIKVQNMEYGWGFACRVIGQKSFTKKLVGYSEDGDLSAIKLLLSYGADINATVETGITPLHAAKMAGRKEVVDYLLDNGANAEIPMPSKEKIIDAYFHGVVKENYPGATILISKDGKILYQNSYGYADVENKIPIKLDTKFRIGSITKQFIGTAILKLQEQGLLNTTDLLSKFIPDFPRGNEVTIHHLLTHTSGIHSFTNKPDFIASVTSPIDDEDLINGIKKDNYDFNPGDKFQYNNSGFFILGYIIEKVSGLNYGDFLEKNFFEPLGMKNTGVHKSDVILENEALGYSYENSKVSKAVNWDMSWAGGAGSLYSTIEDLFKWNEALFNGKVLNEKSIEAAFTPVKTKENNNPAPDNGYGYGWALSKSRGFKVISHSGGLHGFNSDLLRIPELNLTVVVLQNCLPTLPGTNAPSASQKIAEVFSWEQLESQESYEVNKSVSYEVYKDYEGKYEYPGGMILTVTKEDDKLFAQLTGQPRFEIFPKEDNVFFWKVVEAQITFLRDESGQVTGAKHKQGGQEITVSRLKEKTIAQVDPKIYELYTGEYDLSNGSKIAITNEANSIFAQLTNQPKFEIFPESDSEFFFKVVAATLKFYLNDTQEVTHLVLRQGGQEMKAVRIK